MAPEVAAQEFKVDRLSWLPKLEGTGIGARIAPYAVASPGIKRPMAHTPKSIRHAARTGINFRARLGFSRKRSALRWVRSWSRRPTAAVVRMIAFPPKSPPPLYRHQELPEPAPFFGSLKAWVEVERDISLRSPAFLVQMVAEGDPPMRVSSVWTFQVRRGGTRRLAERFARAIEAGMVVTEMELRMDVWGKPYVSIRETTPWTEATGHRNHCLALEIELGRHGIHAGPHPGAPK